MADLKLWHDGTETYVAESAEEARRMQTQLIGDWDATPLEQWKERTAPDPLMLHIEDEGPVEKTLAEWIATNGKGFLCSTEL